MKYENINYVYLLPLVIIMVIAYIVFFKNRQNALQKFVQAELLDRIVLSVSKRKQIAKAAFVIAAILFLVNAPLVEKVLAQSSTSQYEKRGHRADQQHDLHVSDGLVVHNDSQFSVGWARPTIRLAL